MLRTVGCRPSILRIHNEHKRLDVRTSDRWRSNCDHPRPFSSKPFLSNTNEVINRSLKVEEEAKNFLEKHKVKVPQTKPFPAAHKLVSDINTRQMQIRLRKFDEKIQEAEEDELEQDYEQEPEDQQEEVIQQKQRFPAIPVQIKNITNWKALGLDSAILKRLSELGFSTPTDVQKEAIQYISQGADVVVQSQTGTGKTFVFLLPLLTKINKSDTPYQCLILTPSRELAVQIGDELMKIAAIPKEEANSLFQIFVAGNETVEKQLSSIVEFKPKFLIGTPKRIQELFQTNSLQLMKMSERFKYLVLDEADKILQPPSRYETVKEKRNRIRHPPPGTQILQDFIQKNPTAQLVCTSATINSPLRSYLKHWWPRDYYFVKSGPGFGVPSNINHFVIHPKGTASVTETEKMQQLLALFYSQRMTSLLVFVSSQSRILNFVERLKANGIVAVALHTIMTVYEPEKRGKILDLFKKGEIQMLVATDESVRGLDFDWIENVAVMSVPKDANTYLHIAGRTGRQGRHGRVFMFAAEEEKKKLNSIGTYLGVKWLPIEDI